MPYFDRLLFIKKYKFTLWGTLLISIFILSEFSSAEVIRFSPARCTSVADSSTTDTNQVNSFLVEALPHIASGGKMEAHVGALKDIIHLGTSSGMPIQTIYKAVDIIRKILRWNEGQDSVLGNTSTRLELLDVGSERLMICILSDSCKLMYGQGAHVTTNEYSFDIKPFRTFEGTSTKPGSIKLDAGSYTKIPRVIIINGGLDTDAISWAFSFLHEAIHFADFELISDWINANVSLMLSRQIPDELFSS